MSSCFSQCFLRSIESMASLNRSLEKQARVGPAPAGSGSSASCPALLPAGDAEMLAGLEQECTSTVSESELGFKLKSHGLIAQRGPQSSLWLPALQPASPSFACKPAGACQVPRCLLCALQLPWDMGTWRSLMLHCFKSLTCFYALSGAAGLAICVAQAVSSFVCKCPKLPKLVTRQKQRDRD